LKNHKLVLFLFLISPLILISIQDFTVPQVDSEFSGINSSDIDIKFLWNKTGDGGILNSLAVDSSDNLYAVGWDRFYKLNKSGDFLWNITTTEAGFSSVCLDSSENIFISGYLGNDGWLSKFDNNGIKLWNFTFYTPGDDWFQEIATDSNGDVYVWGTYEADGSNPEYRIIKFDSQGNYLWNRTWRDPIRRYYPYAASAIYIDHLDNIYLGASSYDYSYGIAAFHLYKFNTSGGQIWDTKWETPHHFFDEFDILCDSIGNIYAAGGRSELFVLKYNASGTLLWETTTEPPNWYETVAMELDESGNIYCGGVVRELIDSYYHYDIGLLMCDNSGVFQWSYRWNLYPRIDLDFCKDLVLDSSNGLYLSGYTNNWETGRYTFVLLKFEILGMFEISYPNASQVFGKSPPNFIIEKYFQNIESTWYSVNHLGKYVFTGENGVINKSAWDSCSSGEVVLTFYANSTLGKIETESVTVYKDLIAPNLTILNPIPYQLYGNVSPSFNVLVDSPDLDEVWYTLDNGINNYSISGNRGLINQNAWDNCNNGTVDITFYANDTVSNVASETIPVYKDISAPCIKINSPEEFELYGRVLDYDLDIFGTAIDRMWYTLNGGQKNFFTSDSGTINGSIWEDCDDGLVEIVFFINDTASKETSTDIYVYQDTTDPEVIILQLIDYQFFSITPPFFNLSISDDNLDTFWYTLDGGITNFTISSTSGDVNSTAWNSRPDGTVVLSFYANDSVKNIGSDEVLLIKDVGPPEITVNSPLDLTFYANDSPSFELTINDGHLNETWYTLNNGSSYFFTGNSGKINQTAWDLCGNGTVLISFYANDLYDQMSYVDVIVFKDIIAPIINISEPLSNLIYGIISPNFNISILEANLDSVWYQLNGGTIYNINETYGQINLTLWNLASDGSVSIMFYANDTLGNIGYAEIIVEKDSLLPLITIISPPSMQLFGLHAPDFFQVSIYDVDLHSSWYTLNNGPINLFTGTTGSINQDNWNMCGNGTVLMTFYANNSLGHIAYNEVIVQKETHVPGITIINPEPSDTFGYTTFHYEISVDAPSIDSMWYSLNHGMNHTITELSGTILQVAWELCGHGNVTLIFYANNSVSNFGYTEIVIYKDTVSPVITIIEPSHFGIFNNLTFDFEIYIEESGLNMTWYSFDGGQVYFFTGVTGTIAQSAWDSCGNGTHTLTFYANDLYGNYGFNDTIIQKDIYLPIIIVNLPSMNQSCGPLSASFNLTLIGNDIHTTWYTLNDLYKHEFTGTMGKIDQQSWDYFGQGAINIKFYVNTSAGKYVMVEVLVIKRLDIVSRNAYAIVIGVSNYPGTDYDLNYCDDDAIEVHNMLIDDYNFLPSNIILITDASATQSAIDNAFATINSMIQPDDIFYFYYSGHGGSELTSSTSTYYLNSPHPYPDYYDHTWYITAPDAAYIRVHFSDFDLEYDYDYLFLGDTMLTQGYYYEAYTGYDTNFWSDWIPVLNDNRIYLRMTSDYSVSYYGFRINQIEVMRYSNPHYLCPYDSMPSSPTNYYLDTLLDEKLDSLNCDNIYAIMDSCNSGGMIPESQDADRFIITACRDGQVSYEDPVLQNGIFSYYLLNSLDNANDQNSDGVISMEEIFAYVSSGTQIYSGTYGPGYQSHPQISDGISGQAVLYPSIGSVNFYSIGNQLYYSFYLYGHGTLRTLNLSVCSISPAITFKTEEIMYQYVSPTGFGYYAGVIELEAGYSLGGIELFAEIEGNRLITINLRYGDSDGDGLTDFFEIFDGNGLDPTNNDTDGDGLSDGDELIIYNTDPLKVDSDSDGLLDGEEINIYGTNPLSVDTDGDGVNDYDEVHTYSTDPLNTDTDSDAMPDGWEIDNLLDPLTNDTALDPDSDFLINIDEFLHNTLPMNNDTDSDLLLDGEEVFTYNTDPTIDDTDSDGLLDGEEVLTYNTDPNDNDSDSDGLLDGPEVLIHGTNPLNGDTDSDGIPDGWEVDNLLNPLENDADLDPDIDDLTNIEEYQHGTDPQDSDTDNDGWDDGTEVAEGTDPLDPDDHPHPHLGFLDMNLFL